MTTPFERVTLRALHKFDSVRAGTRVDFFDDVLWEQANDHQLGVIALDPVGHKIGMSRRGGFLRNFAPMDRYKQTLVGLCRSYNFFDGSGAEADWCIFLDPHPKYRHLLDDVVQVMESTDDLQVRQGKRCVECEVTPDEQLYTNPHFKKNSTSPHVGKVLGTYGPWVRDGGHGGRPEIHPSEIIWWREGVGPQKLAKWTVLVIQDDSNRFDRKSDFSGTIEHPWSKAPRRASVAFALELKKGFAYRYQLSLGRHRNVAVLTGPIATVNRADYLLQGAVSSGSGGLGGAGVAFPVVSLEVEKKITKIRDLGPGDVGAAMAVGSRTIPPIPDVTSPGMLDARLTKIVADPNRKDVYRAILTVEVQVGTSNDRGGEGYAELILEELSRTRINVVAPRRN